MRGGAKISTLVTVVIAAVLWPSSAAALAPGSLDPSFASGGTLEHQFGATSTFAPYSEGEVVAAQPDGKVLVAGLATDSNGRDEVLVVRLNADGSPDPSFASGGTFVDQVGQGASPASAVTALAVQTDGKIVVAGSATDANGRQAVLVMRLDADGSLDSSFDSTGVLISQQGNTGHANYDSEVNFDSIALDGGKIVLGGQATDIHGPTQFMVIRLNPDGTFDPTFGSNGVVMQQLGVNRSRVSGLALQSDGKILADGDAAISGHDAFLVVRLNPDGSFDTSFGSSGIVNQQLGTGASLASHGFGLAQANNGKIVVGGDVSDPSDSGMAMLARLNPNGSFDSSFGSNGVVSIQLGTSYTFMATTFPGYSQIFNLVLQPNGKIVTGDYATSDTNNPEVTRFNSDGSLDSSFGSGGEVRPVQPTGPNPLGSDQDGLALEPDGKILDSGEVTTGTTGEGQLFVTRLIGDPVPTPSIGASPNPASVGQSVQFSGSAQSDPNGAIPSYSWSFGDGSNATGANAQHAYTKPGSYTATLTVSYSDGVIASATKRVVVPAVQLTGVSQSHKRWRRGNALPHIARAKRPPVGTTFHFKVNQSATVRFAFTQKIPGRKVGHRCVAPNKKNRHRPKCARIVTRGTLSFQVGGGTHKVHFDGRLSKHKKLAPGRYTLIITAGNGTGPPATKKLTFTIVSG